MSTRITHTITGERVQPSEYPNCWVAANDDGYPVSKYFHLQMTCGVLHELAEGQNLINADAHDVALQGLQPCVRCIADAEPSDPFHVIRRVVAATCEGKNCDTEEITRLILAELEHNRMTCRRLAAKGSVDQLVPTPLEKWIISRDNAKSSED